MLTGRTTVVVAAAAALGLGTPSATAAASTMRFVAHVTQGTVVGPGHSQQSLGAAQIGSGVLTDVHGHSLGTFAFTCISVRVHRGYVDEQCTGWGSLAGGQLVLAGKSRSNENRHTWAVTGGTGAYRSARGEARLRDLNDHVTVVDVTLVPAAR
jgi:hypothetical protein